MKKLEEAINIAKKMNEDKGAGYDDSWNVVKTGLDRVRNLSKDLDAGALSKLYAAIYGLATVIKDLDATYPATGGQGA